MCVPYPGGVSNQRIQPTYQPPTGPKPIQPLIWKNTPKYQQYAGYHGQAYPTYGPTGIPMLYQYYNYP